MLSVQGACKGFAVHSANVFRVRMPRFEMYYCLTVCIENWWMMEGSKSTSTLIDMGKGPCNSGGIALNLRIKRNYCRKFLLEKKVITSAQVIIFPTATAMIRADVLQKRLAQRALYLLPSFPRSFLPCFLNCFLVFFNCLLSCPRKNCFSFLVRLTIFVDAL